MNRRRKLADWPVVLPNPIISGEAGESVVVRTLGVRYFLSISRGNVVYLAEQRSRNRNPSDDPLGENAQIHELGVTVAGYGRSERWGKKVELVPRREMLFITTEMFAHYREMGWEIPKYVDFWS